MSDLESQLAEVKALFEKRTGQDIDEGEDLVDRVGMRWVKTVGTGVMKTCAPEEEVEYRGAQPGGRFQTLSRSHHKMLERTYGQQSPPQMSELEAKLAEVMALYEIKTGEAVDEEDLVDEDGMRWVKTVGTGMMKKCAPEEEVEYKGAQAGGRFQTPSRSHHQKLERRYGKSPPKISELETKLSEVKGLFKQKHGHDADGNDAPVPPVSFLQSLVPACMPFLKSPR